MAILPRRSIVYIHTTESCFGWPSVTKKNRLNDKSDKEKSKVNIPWETLIFANT